MIRQPGDTDDHVLHTAYDVSARCVLGGRPLAPKPWGITGADPGADRPARGLMRPTFQV